MSIMGAFASLAGVGVVLAAGAVVALVVICVVHLARRRRAGLDPRGQR